MMEAVLYDASLELIGAAGQGLVATRLAVGLGDRLLRIPGVRPALGRLAVFLASHPRILEYWGRTQYDILYGSDRVRVRLNNYGYAPAGGMPLSLAPEDECHRYQLQMYDHLCGALDFAGKDILEVGCGRGGGAAFVAKTRKPRSYIGLERSPKGVAFCQRHHSVDGLSFRQGDAEALPLDSESVDVVLNVESSHLYGRMDLFLAGVYRVLRPGGHFLCVDHRLSERVAIWKQQIADAGFRVESAEDISAGVVRALEASAELQAEMMNAGLPALAHGYVRSTVGIPGRGAHANLSKGRSQYWRFVLRK